MGLIGEDDPTAVRGVHLKDDKVKHNTTIKLLRRICEEVDRTYTSSDIKLLYSSPFCLAVENNTPEAIDVLTTYFPQSYWFRKDGQNIFQLTVLNRSEKVYSCILHHERNAKFGFSISVDDDGNNILHLAGRLSPIHKLASRPALQMQRELHWFEEVKRVVGIVKECIRLKKRLFWGTGLPPEKDTEFVNLIANQFLKRIKVIRSDNGTEFINNKMENFLKEKGIIHQTSCAYTPQQNGIAERKHRHLLNVARSLLFQGNIPLCFWTDCILTATYLINRLPSSVLAGRSPFCMLYGHDDDTSVCLTQKGLVKYGLNRYANHTVLSGDASCFISNLNKTFEPTYYNDAIKDINWVQAMNNEMEAFNGLVSIRESIALRTLCTEYVFLSATPVATPMPENGILAHKETENDKPLKNVTSYQKIVGKLIYLCNTRPDIAYAVHCLSQHMHSPLQSHFEAALRVLRYLKSAPGAGISYTKSSSSSICAYADSDWAKCKMTRRSVSGYCVFIYGCLVSWKSKKQATLSRSSAEAEYRSMASAVCEVMWIIKVLKDLNFSSQIPAFLFCDNSSAIQIAANPVMHEKTKHFDIDVHLIREKVASGLIKTVKVDSENQIADILTKGLGTMQHRKLFSKLSLLNIFDSYTITATLIISIVFVAAITVPGGNDDKTGKPIYEMKPSFIIFVVADAISLFTATTSLLSFLYILTARYVDGYFLYHLPKRLIYGLVMIFVSVISMMIAFGATLYIMFGQGKQWILIPIGALACLPIASFVTLQFPLLVDLISSTYGPGYFAKERDYRQSSANANKKKRA
ncbi:ribonuclease H-like domain-containing protein [Tanacetum coccineum]